MLIDAVYFVMINVEVFSPEHIVAVKHRGYALLVPSHQGGCDCGIRNLYEQGHSGILCMRHCPGLVELKGLFRGTVNLTVISTYCQDTRFSLSCIHSSDAVGPAASPTLHIITITDETHMPLGVYG